MSGSNGEGLSVTENHTSPSLRGAKRQRRDEAISLSDVAVAGLLRRRLRQTADTAYGSQ